MRSADRQEDLTMSVYGLMRTGASGMSGVGVNLDEELTSLMALEKSFQASSRLITTVNGMFDALLQATR